MAIDLGWCATIVASVGGALTFAWLVTRVAPAEPAQSATGRSLMRRVVSREGKVGRDA